MRAAKKPSPGMKPRMNRRLSAREISPRERASIKAYMKLPAHNRIVFTCHHLPQLIRMGVNVGRELEKASAQLRKNGVTKREKENLDNVLHELQGVGFAVRSDWKIIR